MGKSIRPLVNGSAEEIHGVDDPTGVEMFNNTALFKGQWVALFDHSHPTGKGWELYNIETDPGQNNNVADQNPDLLKQMIADYQNFSQEVGVVVPTGEKAATQYAGIYPALNETQTVNIDEIIPPFKKPNATDIQNAIQSTF